ncbi:MAG: hypothetical protein R2862_09970 [Thermoanaerobaculia bacterium]
MRSPPSWAKAGWGRSTARTTSKLGARGRDQGPAAGVRLRSGAPGALRARSAALAQLHHPNIASIFGLEDSGGVRALVMELVDGPTLAERLAAGPLAIEESLHDGAADRLALEAAHEADRTAISSRRTSSSRPTAR